MGTVPPIDKFPGKSALENVYTPSKYTCPLYMDRTCILGLDTDYIGCPYEEGLKNCYYYIINKKKKNDDEHVLDVITDWMKEHK